MKLWQHQPSLDFPLLAGERFAGMTGATADTEQACYVAPYPVVVQGVKVAFDSAVTGANTNYASIVVNLWRGGVKQGAVASYAFTSGNNAAQFTTLDLGTIAAAYKSLKAGDVLTVALVHTGTGLQLPAGVAVIDQRTPKYGE